MFFPLSPLTKHNIKNITGENIRLKRYHQPFRLQSCSLLMVKEVEATRCIKIKIKPIINITKSKSIDVNNEYFNGKED